MNTTITRFQHFSLPASPRPRVAASLLLLLCVTGCSHPSEDNIRLRKLNQDLQAQVDKLTEEAASRQRTIDGLEKRIPTIPMLPPDELKKLYLTAGLKFGRLSGGVNLSSTKPGDQALSIYVCPTDEFGSSIQAAGSFVVEAFDLAEKGDTHLGRWEWSALAAKAQWRAFLFEFDYELTCPWQKIPKHPDITVRVTFTDELTHIPYTAETVVHADIALSSRTSPATVPTSMPSR